MDLKPLAKQYAEAIIREDTNVLRDIFAEHVRLFYNDQYIEGKTDVIAHFTQQGSDVDHPRRDVDGVQLCIMNLINIYQDSNTVIVEYQVIRSLRSTTTPPYCQIVEIIKFDNEKIVNIHGYYLDSDMSEDTLRMHNELKTTS